MYNFNDNGVCLNPDRIEIANKCCIKLAEHEGMWLTGFDLEYKTGGVGTPCCTKWEKYATRKQARDAAFEGAINHMERQVEWYSKALSIGNDNSGYSASLKQCYIVLASLKEKRVQMTQPIQLSLFD